MNKIGIYFAYWTKEWDADYLYYIDKVAKLGFDILEISTANLFNLSVSDLDKIRNYAQEKEITLTYCIGFPQDKDLASADKGIRDNGIKYACKTLDIINILGGKVFGGINYSSWPGALDEGIIDKRPYLDRSIKCLKEIIKTAEDYGIDYCVEVVNRFEQYLINTAQEAMEYVNEVDSPNIKILLDTFHMNIEEDSMFDAIVTAGGKLGHLHIGENNRKPPGSGNINWNDMALALKKINYKGHIVMEPFIKMGGDVGRDIKVWRDLSNKADENTMDFSAKAALEFIRNKILKPKIY